MRMRSLYAALGAVTVLAFTVTGPPHVTGATPAPTDASFTVAISEIMYNPASSERSPVRTEWVEIYNAGQSDVDVSGWYLQDEDGKTSPLPAGTLLAARRAIVLIPGKQTVENFRAAWGDGFDVYPLKHWSGAGSLHGLSNSPSSTNEILTLRTDKSEVVDAVNYDDRSPWPSDRHAGASIYVTPGSIGPKLNDDGSRWKSSKAEVLGAHHAVQTEQFSKNDIGSPGTVIDEENPVSSTDSGEAAP